MVLCSFRYLEGDNQQSANQAAVQAIRKELAAKSEELAKQLDKLGY